MLTKTSYEMIVDNEIVARDLNMMVPQIQNYLKSKLHNKNVSISVRVSEAQENTRAYSRVERYQMMAQKNPDILKLKETFELELS